LSTQWRETIESYARRGEVDHYLGKVLSAAKAVREGGGER